MNLWFQFLKWERKLAKKFYYHYYEYPGYHWVRRHGVADGRYKLIRFYENDVDQWELFDLKTDQEMKSVYGTAQYAVTQTAYLDNTASQNLVCLW